MTAIHHAARAGTAFGWKDDSNAVKCFPVWERFAFSVRIMGLDNSTYTIFGFRRGPGAASPVFDPT
jgi:hypothetical protein